MIIKSAVAWRCVTKAMQQSLAIHNISLDEGWSKGAIPYRFGSSPLHPTNTAAHTNMPKYHRHLQELVNKCNPQHYWLRNEE